MTDADIRRSEFFLRFAITPNCNFRCTYCNPEGRIQNEGVLTDEEVLQIIRAGYFAGVNRIHWTGGEPTLRNLLSFISFASDLGYVDQVVTTNGSQGGDSVRRMADRGLDRLIVSLDSLNPTIFRRITKRDCLSEVLDTVETAVEILEEPTKLNVVYARDTGDEISGLIDLARRINDNSRRGELIVKFIELTEMNPAFFDEQGKQLFSEEHTGRDIILAELSRFGTLIPNKQVPGNNPNTEYYEMPGLGISIGLITIPSSGYPCGGKGCAKIRLNPYGQIAVCINQNPIDIREKSLDCQVQIIQDLQVYRQIIDRFYPQRQHKQGDSNYGFWRFGDCGKLSFKSR